MPVDTKALKVLRDRLKAAKKELPKAVERGLQKAGDQAIARFQEKARAGGFQPAKAPPREGPPLIDTENYVSSFRANAQGGSLDISVVGDNVTMPNTVLANVLEYSKHGRVHLRPMADALQEDAPKIVGQEVLNVLRGI